MRLLVLGGTEFVGRAVVEAALGRGWEVTVLHRGRHAPPAGARALHGDRTAPDGLAALAGAEGTWDAVVDTWSAAPRAVRDAARLLRDRAGRYVYVSSRSVYAWPPPAGCAEDAPLVEGASADAGQSDYARDKRGGELAATDAFGADRSVLVRAGLILGPYENVGRLPWWLNRVARGGPVLAPGPRDLPLQYIDVRDLADWTLGAVERELSGPYNLVSPPGHTTMGGLLDACARVTGGAAQLRWTDPATVLAAGIEPWVQLPVWTPPDSDLYDALHTADVTRARATGLACRPVEDTVADTWTWLRDIGGTAPRRPDRPPVGLDPETEAKALASADGPPEGAGVPGTTP
ncbi:SDR family oxidoreductase [Streptomyces sp. KPB2]|uniref:SDR family oxidoreductase n=1 Tax=Streptomyces TaxID=1883 RepID=UPI000F6CBB44|nr:MULTISPECIES: SDR family oxidoreductase [Streptomyces]WSU04055.1 SDR family oxidoreductase [Streptomyces sp. NBC_01124]AZM78095.1 SDR family oxidoreductase [Streptomyces sp. KPB2]MBH5132689.1 SDR family oxidoreductase [Streptomyces sp. HB-N217]MDU0253545.1 SDR family oxidoreductase [Streptomyces sp. PU10]QKW63679.1 SDR family oxidoreductase [Streptomyces sp. NA03103]